MDVEVLSLIINSINLIILLFLGVFQINQVITQLKMDNFSRYVERYQNIIQHIPLEYLENPELDFPPDEYKKKELEHNVYLYFDLWSQQYVLLIENLLSKRTKDIWIKFLKKYLKCKIFKSTWDKLITDIQIPFDPAFVKFISEILQNNKKQ